MTNDDLNRKIAEARGEVQALGYITVSSNDGALIEDSTAEAWPRYDEWPDAGGLLEEMYEASKAAVPVRTIHAAHDIDFFRVLDALMDQLLKQLENRDTPLPEAIRAAYAEWKGLT